MGPNAADEGCTPCTAVAVVFVTARNVPMPQPAVVT